MNKVSNRFCELPTPYFFVVFPLAGGRNREFWQLVELGDLERETFVLQRMPTANFSSRHHDENHRTTKETKEHRVGTKTLAAFHLQNSLTLIFCSSLAMYIPIVL